MNTPSNKRAALAAVAATLALGAAGGALAQSSAVGGTTTDNTSAGNANGGGLPQIQQQGDVSFVSGGVGSDESSALKRAQHDWPLALRFTGPGTEYLADVHVRIVNAHDGEVLNAESRGPYMLVRLRPGRYTVHAAYNGKDQMKAVTVSGSGSTKADFYWNSQ
ncbi:carboxypeptidase regulatory-like domain-containing protein [Trinickia terrae]|uniref:Carboxypeptidase regulatory-like domain-containing protein n=1 Tax=Trinickia terrae TaxID=2571161 RepID=A0A4U1I8K0_9BURK|nr:carboxypeptidase regulatory-like domain-containing protein [Trinickia terrae]TKC89768.1 carboxypeptidase regulatory-like domain-containing protein [Trinickia terrae]